MIMVQSKHKEEQTMKINEAEQILGITKANIRFYEKEGLLSPGRTEKGYREYTEADIARLKEIVIYRKLGISVQQIADLLDGAISLQDVLDENIKTLTAEIEKLNGSLALCQQLKAENAESLDTSRYWDILQNKELAGYQFQSLVSDYINFLAPTLSWAYLIPEEFWHEPKKILKGLAIWSILYAGAGSLLGENFLGNIFHRFIGFLVGILVWIILYIPIYRLSKKNPSLAKTLEVLIPVLLLIFVAGLFIWSLISMFP